MGPQGATGRPAGALDGVRVLDFTAVMAGPFATRLLADLGADVVKIESLEGDQVRARPPLREGASAYFGHLNAGKRSLALNLKSPEAARLVRELASRFDVVVENFRPGVMRRLGLDFETLASVNPKLIYCSISGYGQTGPSAQNPAYAPVVHAASGFEAVNLSYQEQSDAAPATSGVFIADVLAGTYAFGAIQAGLYQRERTGRGQFIDVSLFESMVGMLVFELQQAQFPECTPKRPLYRPLRTSDGYLMVAPTSPRNFEQLCEATGHPEWRQDPRFLTNADRNAHWRDLLAAIEEWTQQRTAQAAEEILVAHGVPCSRYRTVAEVLNDPQLAARRAFAQVADASGTYWVANPPFKMSGSRVEAREEVSALGQHGPELLGEELGLSAEAIEDLRRCGVLG